jgi:hypothetical protein
MSRFTVGKHYVFFVVKYDGLGTVYWPGRDKLQKLVTLYLLCESEHAVPIEWSKDVGEGYVFLDEKTGVRWHNQFPVASYGQMDDSGDRRVEPELEAWDNFSQHYPELGDATWIFGREGMSMVSSVYAATKKLVLSNEELVEFKAWQKTLEGEIFKCLKLRPFETTLSYQTKDGTVHTSSVPTVEFK